MKLNENKLWKWFSIFIRLRDSDTNGVLRCFTCGAFRHWRSADCGHGIGRQHRATKYSEVNNHGQCKQCNGFEAGKADVYKERVDERYGPGTWDKLLIQSKQVTRWGQFEIDLMAKDYQQRAQEIALEKGIKIN